MPRVLVQACVGKSSYRAIIRRGLWERPGNRSLRSRLGFGERRLSWFAGHMKSFPRWAVLHSHTKGMKTIVSIPDDVFEDAERLARRTKKSAASCSAKHFESTSRDMRATRSPLQWIAQVPNWTIDPTNLSRLRHAVFSNTANGDSTRSSIAAIHPAAPIRAGSTAVPRPDETRLENRRCNTLE